MPSDTFIIRKVSYIQDLSSKNFGGGTSDSNRQKNSRHLRLIDWCLMPTPAVFQLYHGNI